MNENNRILYSNKIKLKYIQMCEGNRLSKNNISIIPF